jgi:hypothetical protein
LVGPGTYEENCSIDKPITLASNYLHTANDTYVSSTIVDGGGGTVLDIPASASSTRIVGLTIQNGDDGIYTDAVLSILYNRFTGHEDAIDYEGGGGVCRGNEFFHNRDDAVDLDGPTAVVVENNLIRDNEDDGVEMRFHEYSGETLYVVFRDNVILRSGEDGIQFIDYSDGSDRHVLVTGNLIAHTDMAAIGMMDGGNTREDYRGAQIPEPIWITNNTIVGANHGITGGANAVLVNNIIAGSEVAGVKSMRGGSISSHNLFWNNRTDLLDSSGLDDGTSFAADPQLDENRRPISGSPAVDAGTAYFERGGSVVVDIRDYMGEGPDLGWQESE